VSTAPQYGAAVDVTLVDSTGQTVNMGSAIDELSPRSHPITLLPVPPGGTALSFPPPVVVDVMRHSAPSGRVVAFLHRRSDVGLVNQSTEPR